MHWNSSCLLDTEFSSEQTFIFSHSRQLFYPPYVSEEIKSEMMPLVKSIITFLFLNITFFLELSWPQLRPLLELCCLHSDLFNCFFTVLNKNIPRDFVSNEWPFDLYWLLLVYHNPETETKRKKRKKGAITDESLFSLGFLGHIIKDWRFTSDRT